VAICLCLERAVIDLKTGQFALEMACRRNTKKEKRKRNYENAKRYRKKSGTSAKKIVNEAKKQIIAGMEAEFCANVWRKPSGEEKLLAGLDWEAVYPNCEAEPAAGEISPEDDFSDFFTTA
jgi:hypothetical protein